MGQLRGGVGKGDGARPASIPFLWLLLWILCVLFCFQAGGDVGMSGGLRTFECRLFH